MTLGREATSAKIPSHLLPRQQPQHETGICRSASSSLQPPAPASSLLPSSLFSVRMYSVMAMLLVSWIIPAAEAATSKHLSRVTCGSVVKLINANFMAKLHSHDVKYGSGSGQQSVTGTDESDDGSSYWQIKGASSAGPCTRGSDIKCGDSIRLTHLATGKNLHSHLFSSPLSGEQEVSAFGADGEGDTGDNWTVVCAADVWRREETVKLKHVDTERFLTMTGRTYGRPISGHIEVVATKYPDSSAYWRTGEGVFVKPDEGGLDPGSSHDEL